MTGIAVAIGAQAALYLTLRRIAVATMPAWAHGHAHHPVAAGAMSSVVGVSLVAAPAAPPPAPDALAVPPPTLQPVPVVPVPPPVLPPSGMRGSDPQP